MPEEQEVTSTELPRAPVLSYITRAATTPTRVRLVAAWGVLVVALVYGALMLACAYLIYQDLRNYLGWRWTTLQVIFECWQYSGTLQVETVFSGISLVMGCVLVILAGAVRRGRRLPSLAAAWCMFPLMLLIAAVVIVRGGMAIIEGAGLVGRAEPWAFWWLLIVPPGVLGILLLKDLCAYLFWIARNPISEKLPVDFLPGKGSRAGSAR